LISDCALRGKLRDVEINELTGVIVNAAFQIHQEAGPGLLESVYEILLADSLASHGIPFARQAPIAIKFRGKVLDGGFRADLVADNRVIIEIKSIDRLAPLHKKQLLTYLKLSGLRVGLLINFGGERLKGNIERLVVGEGIDLKDWPGPPLS
jgi:iron complex transport system substrate-binding protein